jgi:hypothetical protein
MPIRCVPGGFLDQNGDRFLMGLRTDVRVSAINRPTGLYLRHFRREIRRHQDALSEQDVTAGLRSHMSSPGLVPCNHDSAWRRGRVNGGKFA